MDFVVRPLPKETFDHLASLSAAELQERHIEVHVADKKPGYPCRVTLRDAEPGQRLLLLNHTHHDVDGPYRSSHAVFVTPGAEAASPQPGEVPELIRRRQVSVRAFDEAGTMLEAELIQGADAARVFERLLAADEVSYLHVHTATRGCYLARVEAAHHVN